MNHAKWLAILALAGASLGCSTPCKRVALTAVALDKECAVLARDNKDMPLAVACATAYLHVVDTLTAGTCSAEIRK
jgi:hypothetical protein